MAAVLLFVYSYFLWRLYTRFKSIRERLSGEEGFVQRTEDRMDELEDRQQRLEDALESQRVTLRRVSRCVDDVTVQLQDSSAQTVESDND